MNFTLNLSDVEALLREDVPYFDLTSSLLNLSSQNAEILFAPKEPVIVSGSEEVAKIFTLLDVATELIVASGHKALAGETVLKAYGNAEQLHMGWKVSQNILEHFSAIATRTRSMVEGANRSGKSVEICGTRKHLPGTKHLSLKALCSGGGSPHRLGLSDSILIFSNHYGLLGGLKSLCTGLQSIKARCPEKKVAVEVESIHDAITVAEAGADIVQLDKLSHESVRKIAEMLKQGGNGTTIAAAGGINDTNAEKYAAAGADVLVSSWMYFGKPADYKVIIRKT
ncbi:ModD protein [Prosthecochloris sp. SCSIO W1101]|uniref:ModD protein n=1 Tax=Prosthecochloris sp. SCSIO W1101 TaxID=2992242 RepID=UPI00223E4643|nr:ModD protein [Prosthecochloris sp. SCSIO W1101]UZJ42406.1 ModD protein [Prosthecochloris sp. SCSIO W1101]